MNVRVRKQLALREAEIVFAQEVSPALSGLGDELRERVRSKMREDTGEAKRKVKKRVTGSGYRRRLLVTGELPQHVVDEQGRRPGRRFVRLKQMRSKTGKEFTRKVVLYTGMPPSGPGSNLDAWAKRRGITNTFLLARKIARDGIAARRPFERTKEESLRFIRDSIDAAIGQAVKRLNA